MKITPLVQIVGGKMQNTEPTEYERGEAAAIKAYENYPDYRPIEEYSFEFWQGYTATAQEIYNEEGLPDYFLSPRT